MRSGDEISELQLGVARHKHTAIVHLNLTLTLTLTIGPKLALFPGPARSSLAVRNSRRFHTVSDERAGPGNEAS